MAFQNVFILNAQKNHLLSQGRTFKIEVEYIPVKKEKDSTSKSNKIDVGPYLRIMQMIDKKVKKKEVITLMQQI